MDEVFQGWQTQPRLGEQTRSRAGNPHQPRRTLAQGALAWLWARSPKTLPIPGFRTVKQVQENAGAMKFGPLTAEQMAEIDKLLDR
jgi:aryl-alcohol dehydrogenase-like predicted oxidoreductase